MKNYYSVGTWNVICDVCGRKMKYSHAKHRWDGFIVCDSCFEHRHPQDLIRTKPDKQTVPYNRPPQDTFIEVTYYVNTLTCTPIGSTGEANRGTANCARADIRTMNDLVD